MDKDLVGGLGKSKITGIWAGRNKREHLNHFLVDHCGYFSSSILEGLFFSTRGLWSTHFTSCYWIIQRDSKVAMGTNRCASTLSPSEKFKLFVVMEWGVKFMHSKSAIRNKYASLLAAFIMHFVFMGLRSPKQMTTWSHVSPLSCYFKYLISHLGKWPVVLNPGASTPRY